MAVPYPRVRAVFGGTMFGAQSWSTAINVAYTTAPGATANQAVLDTWIQNRVINVRDWWSNTATLGSLASLMSTQVVLNYLRAYYYPANSDTASILSEASFGTALPGIGSVNLPPQSAMVVSTRSGTPGRRGRGRMYLPTCAAGVAANGRFPNAACDLAAVRTSQLLTDFSGSQLGGADIQSVVASTAGAYAIIRVEVDNDVDTQRRRSDKVLFTYKASAAVTT